MTTLARCIQIAHKFAPDKWGIRISKSGIILKVGFPEVLHVGDGVFHSLISNKLVPAKTRKDRRFEFSATPYKKAPNCDTCNIDIADFKDSFSLFMVANEAAIEIAAKSQINSSTPRSHSTELVNLISRMTNNALPQPTYIETSEKTFLYPDEQNLEDKFLEGAATRILVNRYERDPAARHKCVEHHGTDCKACGISFGDSYGPSVNGFIHVHHLTPLGDVREQKAIDPIRDLQPVCPNCHAVIHSKKPPLSIDQVRSLIQKHEKPRSAN
jgi:predicted HNH restriction endonuclease